MSYASNIISSVNNKSDSSYTDNIAEDKILSNDNDIAFKTDINTQIKDNSTSNKKSKSKSFSFLTFLSFGFLGNISYILFGFVFLLLILQYYNIQVFGSLGDVIDSVINAFYNILLVFYYLFKPLVDKMSGIFYGSGVQFLYSAAVGAKTISTNTSETTDKITDPIINDIELPESEEDTQNIKIAEKLKHDINNQTIKTNPVNEDNIDSNIQKKTGWCYIGEDQGVRKCVEIGNNKCLSGLVYSTNEICVNNIK